MSFFYSHPKHSTQKIAQVGDAIKQLSAFNAMNEAGYGAGGASVDNCDADDQFRASWRKLVYDGVINTGGDISEIDFFERALGFEGQRTNATELEASELFIKYRGARDYNIVAQATVDASADGQPATFTLLRSLHSVDGKFSNVVEGGHIYNYDDSQMMRIMAVNTSTDFSHQVTVLPLSKDYKIRIRQGSKMLFNPVRMINGMSCSIPNSTWETPGYVQSVKPYRLRKDWETPMELDKPYEEVLQFALTFDREGNQTDSWEYQNTTTAREEFTYMRNIQFFMGQPTDNPLLLTGGTNLNEKYSGFMGLLPTLQYAGGTIYDIDAAEGYDLNTDFEANLVYQDSMKQGSEYMILHSLQFWLNMVRRSGKQFMDAPGSCTFQSFVRSHGDNVTGDDIRKLGIQSYHFANSTVHFKKVGAFSDKRALGHGIFPYIGIMMPTTGIKTSTGRDVPPVEFFNQAGPYSSYSEIMRNHLELESGCEKYSGTIMETIQMAVHAPERMVLLNPIL